MPEREGNTFYNLDWLTVLLYVLLIGFGILNIYSANYDETVTKFLDFTHNYGKQIIWAGVGIVLAIVILIIDSRVYSTFAYLFYGLAIFLLVATLVFGTTVAGSKSWFEFGGVRLQPAELAKFGTVIALARFLNTYNIKLSNLKHRFLAFGIIFLPMALIVLQNDMGSALVFTALVLVLFRFGLPAIFIYLPALMGILFLAALLYNKIVVIAVLVVISVVIYWITKAQKRIFLVIAGFLILCSTYVFAVDYAFNNFLQPHQQSRINVLLGKEIDLKGAGYNVHQSLIAIGSGGLDGKGFLNGTQTKFKFVPEQSTDFIFCTVGEEYGWIGSSLVIIVFTILLIRIILLAESQKAFFAKVYGYGVTSILFFHFAVNIGMTLGMLPVVGIPLPFLSYGGSSLLGFTVLLFVFLKLDASKKEFFN